MNIMFKDQALIKIIDSGELIEVNYDENSITYYDKSKESINKKEK